MKTFKQLTEESVQLDEVFGLFGNRQTNDIKRRIKDATDRGPDEEAKEKINIMQEMLGGIVRVVKAHPQTVAIGLGVFLADLTIASTRRDMYKAGVDRRGETLDPNLLPVSLSGWLAGKMISALQNSSIRLIQQMWPYLLGLMVAGFSIIGIYKLLRLLVVRGPEWLDAMITTRDERALAYTLKKEFDTDVYTQDIRTGSPGQGKIGSAPTSAPAKRGRPPKVMDPQEAMA